MWELTLDEWEKTVLVNPWLEATFFGMPGGLEASMSVDWHLQHGFMSPRSQIGF